MSQRTKRRSEKTAELLLRVARILRRREKYCLALKYPKPEDVDAEFHCMKLAQDCERFADFIGKPKQMEFTATQDTQAEEAAITR